MTVLVTGASGMLGGAVAQALLDAGHQVRTFQRGPCGLPGAQEARGSVTDPTAVDQAVAGVEAVVHLAAKVSLSGEPGEFVAVNVDGTRNLLDAARRHGATRFVQVSSPSVAHTGTSIVGADAEPADPERARGHYARTKAASELLALAADGPDLGVVAVRPHVVWGPGDTQLVERVVERARAGRLPLLGHGAALIDTTYVDNAAGAIVAALGRLGDQDGTVRGQAYVVTNGEPRTVAEMLAGMCRAFGVPEPRVRVPGAVARLAGSLVEQLWSVDAVREALGEAVGGDGEPPMTRFLAEQLSTAHWFDQRRTRDDLRWSPSVTIEEGLARLASAAG
ncbi:NAD-dependent epimerase/dehydratase family protein [Cellulomonas bogoriensis]|uniref:Nucleoside-diphosphate sugar epimerase n=1 Tax=Cellulomonas bogoriensis 69B4 = DSM 16987 TaxID=1386082 RepID=A0A0A0BYC0_9CELL|nr:NAD-dependent epimerase/dehydratase family protein [Cellulomonas bogoriensis]KGM12921.1 nucleoside-diphosphate sugar epimerase [Cellulomonas bogoriensis 69B4 = DSM 16987]